MMSARLPRRQQNILAAQQKARARRSFQHLAAAVRHNRSALRKMDVRHRNLMAGGIDENRNVLRLRDLRDRFHIERRAIVGGDVDHRRPWIDGVRELLGRLHHDDGDAGVADAVVVHVARRARNDDLGLLEAGQIRNANEPLRIAAGQNPHRHELQTSGGSRRHHAPFGARQLRQPLTDAHREFVELDVVETGRGHRLVHNRPRDRSADDRVGVLRVDERKDADGLVDLLAERERIRCGPAGESEQVECRIRGLRSERRHRPGAHHPRGRREAADPERISAAPLSALLGVRAHVCLPFARQRPMRLLEIRNAQKE